MKYQDFLDAMERRNRNILEMRKRKFTLVEIGRKYGLSKQRIFQIVAKLLTIKRT